MLSLLLLTASDPLAGEWRGTSLCQVRPSPCNDEQAVYVIERKGAGYLIHFGKIVSGKPEEFGVTPATFDARTGRVTAIGHGRGGDFTWHFQVKGDHLTGVLNLPNGTSYRKADLTRVTAIVRPLG